MVRGSYVKRTFYVGVNLFRSEDRVRKDVMESLTCYYQGTQSMLRVAKLSEPWPQSLPNSLQARARLLMFSSTRQHSKLSGKFSPESSCVSLHHITAQRRIPTALDLPRLEEGVQKPKEAQLQRWIFCLSQNQSHVEKLANIRARRRQDRDM